jgi:hypothetical protein
LREASSLYLLSLIGLGDLTRLKLVYKRVSSKNDTINNNLYQLGKFLHEKKYEQFYSSAAKLDKLPTPLNLLLVEVICSVRERLAVAIENSFSSIKKTTSSILLGKNDKELDECYYFFFFFFIIIELFLNTVDTSARGWIYTEQTKSYTINELVRKTAQKALMKLNEKIATDDLSLLQSLTSFVSVLP